MHTNFYYGNMTTMGNENEEKNNFQGIIAIIVINHY